MESTDDSDDQRDMELSTISAIYPEMVVDEKDPYTFALDVPVNPTKAVTVFFPAAGDGTTPNPSPAMASGPAGPAAHPHAGAPANQAEDSHELSHLPSLSLQITLPQGYPDEQPPRVTVSTSPPWLPAEVVKRLEDDGPRLWEELGRTPAVYAYIDHVQQATEDAFGLVDEKGALKVDLQHKIAILDYDIKAKRAAFDKETFNCGVCLEPKKGAKCHRMMDCGHVFCASCLQDFYNNAIEEGDLASVRCLEPNCAKEREAEQAAGKKRRKAKTFISPSELLQIPLDEKVVKRYVSFMYKNELESDKNTIYCPRTWCNGAARSKKHKKPQGLELALAEEDDESEDEPDKEGGGGASTKDKKKPATPTKLIDLLAICEDCGFAFCSRCFQSWHGEFVRCTSRRDKEELSAEEKASLDYMALHTTPCPTCAAPAQKTHGCNHMICYRCQTHFCYLCSAWLDPSNPYQHFNRAPGGQVTGCFMRLWELEAGDGEEVGLAFEGGADGEERELIPQQLIPEVEEAEDDSDSDSDSEDDEDEDEEEVRNVPMVRQARAIHARGGAANLAGAAQRAHRRAPAQEEEQLRNVAVAREGPLVLRIAREQPPRPPPPPPQQPQPMHQLQPELFQQRDGAGRGGGAVGGGRGRGRGGGGAGGPRPQNINNNHRDPAAVLDEERGAWVRNFVQHALRDREHLIEFDSDEDNDDVAFWREEDDAW